MRSARMPLSLLAGLSFLAAAGCGASAVAGGPAARPRAAAVAAVTASRATRTAAPTPPAAKPGASAQAGAGHAVEVADPQEAQSFPAPASARKRAAAAPETAGRLAVAAGAASDAEVREELARMQAAEAAAKRSPQASLRAVAGGRSIGGNGQLAIPQNVPEAVQAVIAGANEIADFPYVFGGGHASFIDSAYDCSGSVSYALAAAGLLSQPETSGELEHWGVPGPGRYITVLANAGHTYMYVDGVLYDTAGRSGIFASRWQVGSVDNAGFVARHWPGL
jgi:cell wall-associated NlpC family hydrolase